MELIELLMRKLMDVVNHFDENQGKITEVGFNFYIDEINMRANVLNAISNTHIAKYTNQTRILPNTQKKIITNNNDPARSKKKEVCDE